MPSQRVAVSSAARRVWHGATAAVRGSGGVVLAGPAGVGKTRLARQLLSEAARRAGATRWIGATAAARGVPLGAFAALVADCEGPADASLLGRAAATVRGDVEGLAVDDAHLLDDVSATVLHQLAAERATRLVVTVRSGEPTSDAVTAAVEGWPRRAAGSRAAGRTGHRCAG